MNMETRDFRVIFFYEFKLGRSAAEAARNICKAFGEGSVNERTIRRWFAKFSTGDTDLENQPRGRPPTVIENDDLKHTVEGNPYQTVRELSAQLSASAPTVSRHLKCIGKVKKLDTWVPHDLTERQQLKRLETCVSLLARQKTDPFLERIITCDEKWIAYDNQRRSGQWLDIDESPGQMPKPNLHPKKLMVTVWWSMAGIIHYSFLPRGETITSTTYCNEIGQMHEKLLKKQPGLVNRKGPILLHDNARPHVSKLTVHKLKELGYEVLPHPPYSPDLSPTDYHLFRNLDNFLRGKIFANDDEIKSAFSDFVSLQSSEFFKSGIKKLVSRWEKCVEKEGKYFE